MMARSTGTLRVLAAAFALALSVATGAAASWTLALRPSADIAGGPGETVGWGYELENLYPDRWILLTGISADPFQDGTPDSSVFDFPAIGPGATAIADFVANSAGLFQFTWDVGAPPGAINTGTFVLTAELYDDDPFGGGAFVEPAPDAEARYSVRLASASAPEPGSVLLVFGGFAALALRRPGGRPSRTD